MRSKNGNEEVITHHNRNSRLGNRTNNNIHNYQRNFQRRNSLKITLTISMLLVIICLISICFNSSPTKKNSESSSVKGVQSQSYLEKIPTIIPPKMPNKTPTSVNNKKINIEKDQIITCAGAPTSRLKINEDAKICTNDENLRLRSYPGTSGRNIIKSYSPGTVVWVFEGPECSNRMYWWKVKTPDGNVGWLAEGGATKTTYYLCPN